MMAFVHNDLYAHAADISTSKEEIDRLVYDHYGFTVLEIEIVEGKRK